MALMMEIMVNNGIWGHTIFRGSGNWNILPYTDWMRCTTAVQKRTYSESLSQKVVVVKGELWRWLHLLLQLSKNVQLDPQILYDLDQHHFWDWKPCHLLLPGKNVWQGRGTEQIAMVCPHISSYCSIVCPHIAWFCIKDKRTSTQCFGLSRLLWQMAFMSKTSP